MWRVWGDLGSRGTAAFICLAAKGFSGYHRSWLRAKTRLNRTTTVPGTLGVSFSGVSLIVSFLTHGGTILEPQNGPGTSPDLRKICWNRIWATLSKTSLKQKKTRLHEAVFSEGAKVTKYAPEASQTPNQNIDQSVNGISSRL
jgi:hypothetical protein